jgi:2-polyprenyl-3-methyl-5-hydroxy-6-metoxy-1,4-benzoquinol methylase
MARVRRELRFQYASRAERARFIGTVYGEFLEGDVLDVGCSGAALREAVKGRYVGVDIAGNPDYVVDLEKQTLPFADGTFDCVVCSDVLEHLDTLHRTFDELIRVSRRYVIVSLPNCRNYEMIYRIWSGRSLKFYGLPPQVPEDRHKWFFGFHDAVAFMRERSADLGVTVAAADPQFLRYRGIKGGIILALVRVLALTRARFEDLGSMAAWVVLEKKHS